MKTSYPSPKKLSLAAVIIISVLTTFAATALIGWFLGFHPSHQTTAIDSDGEKKTVWTCGMHPWIMEKESGACPICGMKLTPKKEEKNKAAGERKIVYWRAPMNSKEIYDRPGKSAMGMDLVPVYEDELIGGVSVFVDPVVQQNMGVRTAIVEKGPLTRVIRVYGHVNYNETRIALVSLKVGGWIEKVYVDFTGKAIKKGEPLFDIYSPELLTAQEEYLTALKTTGASLSKHGRALLKSARRRLQYFDVPEDQIKLLEKSGRVTKALTIRSPFSGVAIVKNVELGAYLKAGAAAYRIADLSKVWVEARVYEYDLPWISQNQEAEIIFPRRRNKSYTGKISHIYPYLNSKTREATVRMEFENPDLSFKPGMYVDVKIKSRSEREGLIIPSEAVIRSGERTVVFVARKNNKFVSREIKTGLSLDNHRLQALEGLAPGEIIVVSGQFLLDSESKLKEASQKMTDPKPIKSKEENQDFFDDLEE